jgi:arylsulfatase A-like enzyme
MRRARWTYSIAMGWLLLLVFSRSAATADRRPNVIVFSVNLLPHLADPSRDVPHATHFWRMGDAAALRQGPWKIVRPGGRGSAAWELYTLTADLSESRKLAAEEPLVLQRLVKKWSDLNAQIALPLANGQSQ